MFFIILSNVITTDAEKTANIKTTERLKTILSAAENNEESIKELKELGYEATFLCEFGQLYYQIKDKNTEPEIITTNTLFVPKTIGKSKLNAWSTTYQAPYDITTTLLLTDEKTMYLFDNSSDSAKKIYYAFPEEISKELIDLSSNKITFEDQGHRKYIFVTGTNPEPQIAPPNLKQKITIIKIPQNTNQGEIKFYDYKEPNYGELETSTKAFTTQEILQGAIISGDSELYECTLNNIHQREKIIAQMNIKRIELINKTYDSRHKCSIYFSTTILTEPLNGIINALENFDTDYINHGNNIEELNKLNNELRRISCPMIY